MYNVSGRDEHANLIRSVDSDVHVSARVFEADRREQGSSVARHFGSRHCTAFGALLGGSDLDHFGAVGNALRL